MIRRTRRKTRWVRVATLCSVAAAAAVVLVARGVIRQSTKGLEAPRGVPVRVTPRPTAATGSVCSERAAAVEIPKDWNWEDSIRPLYDDASGDTLSRVVDMGASVLLNHDVPIEGVTSHLSDLLEEIADARQNEKIAPIEERIDLSRHSREEVLAAIDEYLGGLRWLREVETGLESGLVSLDGVLPEIRREDYIRHLVVSALECRAVFEARRGETDTALRSYRNGKQMQHVLAAASGSACGSLDWQLQRIVDFAWRSAPLAASHRDLILQELTPSTPWAAFVEARLHREVERQRRHATKDSGIDVSRPLHILSQLSSLHELNKKYDVLDARVRDLTPILARAPWEALPVLRDIVSRDCSERGGWVLVVEEAARRCMDVDLYSQVDAARLAFALKDYKYEHGSYPISPEGLSTAGLPPLPVDPACGKSMIYESDGKSFSISLPERPPLPRDTAERVKWLYPHPFRRRVSVWHALE